VELAVALAVIGIAAVVVTPSYRAWRERAGLRDAVGALAGAMVAAHARAIVERRNYTVTADYAGDTWSVAPAGIEARRWPGIDVHSDNSDPDCPSLVGQDVTFRPNGTATTAGFEAVYVRSTSPRVLVRYRVKILGATGKVTVERLAEGTWQPQF